jgi:hypothetical protein
VRSRDLKADLRLIFVPEANGEQGLFARLSQVEVTELSGSLRLAGMPLSKEWVRSRVEQELRQSLPRSVGTVVLIDPRISLGQPGWGALEIVPPLVMHDSLIETRFRWRERQ